MRISIPCICTWKDSLCNEMGSWSCISLALTHHFPFMQVVVSGEAGTPAEVQQYASCTLLSACMETSAVQGQDSITACIAFLQDNEFITLSTQTQEGGKQKTFDNQVFTCLYLHDKITWAPGLHNRQTSDIIRTLVGNKIVDHSDVVGASPVGAAPTTSSFST